MQLRKRALRFFVFFLIVFGASLATWNVVGSAYSALFRSAGDILAVGSGSWAVRYSPHLDPNANHDTQVLLRNRDDSLQRNVALSSRRMAYMPTAFLIALTLATPIARRRKLVTLLWGFIGVNFFIAIRLALVPATYIAKRGEESHDTVLTTLEWVFSGSSSGWMLVPLVIWLTITLKCGLPLNPSGPSESATQDNPT